MDFGQALKALKDGKWVARAGWNGKGMWLVLVAAAGWNASLHLEGASRERLPLLPFVGMKTADGGFVPWLASHTDLLAEDWEVVT